MTVFMKATEVEEAMIDFILLANRTCCSADSEEKQLSDIFSELGLQYDADAAAEMGGTPCFSGPEGKAQAYLYVWNCKVEFQASLCNGIASTDCCNLLVNRIS